MWTDNETERDFLNFTGVSDTVAEIIVQAKGRPISIGVSGAWGVGKSSMIRLVHRSLNERSENGNGKFLFVEFNAWLYQGYDDARAALMEVIGEKLTKEAEKNKKGLDKAKEFVQRIQWFRLTKLVVGSAAAAYAGIPPVGLLGDLYGAGKALLTHQANAETIDKGSEAVDAAQETASELVGPKKVVAPPQEIHALRESFEKTLEAMGVTLVVLIDDLDRCLPETTISTLEAIRLFLFLKNTAFVIAADDAMIKYAVRRHFPDVDDIQAINYFDKLIQLPIRVPPLGTQEVRAYLMLLYVENSDLDDDVKEKIRAGVCKQLSLTWQGKRVDRAYIQSLHDGFDPDLIGRFDTADRLAHLMATASGIAGNPRLIKRFLNALSIRMSISRAQGVGVDEAVLAKMLLFERVGNADAYAALSKAVTESGDGRTKILAEWEEKAHAGQELSLPAPWNDPFVIEWLTLPPRLADEDLRGVLYVSREHAPLISPQDRLSSEAAELLEALLQEPAMAASLKNRIAKIARAESTVIMDRLLDKARQEQSWGVPPVLEACLVVAAADPAQSSRLAAFLADRTPAQIKADIIPKIEDLPWADGVFAKWEKSDGLATPVKASLKRRRTDGNVRVQ
jgi:predicted KAP-like P-loop ATPase